MYIQFNKTIIPNKIGPYKKSAICESANISRFVNLDSRLQLRNRRAISEQQDPTEVSINTLVESVT